MIKAKNLLILTIILNQSNLLKANPATAILARLLVSRAAQTAALVVRNEIPSTVMGSGALTSGLATMAMTQHSTIGFTAASFGVLLLVNAIKNARHKVNLQGIQAELSTIAKAAQFSKQTGEQALVATNEIKEDLKKIKDTLNQHGLNLKDILEQSGLRGDQLDNTLRTLNHLMKVDSDTNLRIRSIEETLSVIAKNQSESNKRKAHRIFGFLSPEEEIRHTSRN